MDRRFFATTVIAAAVGLASAATVLPSVASADDMSMMQKMKQMQQANRDRAMMNHLVACYGINAAHKNDCAVGAHSCAGQATSANDRSSFVLLPAGDCEKINGGSLKAG